MTKTLPFRGVAAAVVTLALGAWPAAADGVLTLEEAIAIAEAQNQQLAAAGARVDAAAATLDEARSMRLPRLDLAALGRLDFETPDVKRFPCLDLAYQALRADEAAPAVLNAANEIAVAAFLEGRIPFPGIASLNRSVLEDHVARDGAGKLANLEDVMDADRWSRERARAWLDREGGDA